MKMFNTKNAINTISNTVNNLFSKKDKIKDVPINSLKIDAEYKSLYHQEDVKVEHIAENMKLNGFDQSQPIIVLMDNTIVDGHSRYLAAKKAGLTTVPVIYKNITDRTDVLAYMEHLQLDRRNLTDAEKVIHYENLMKLKSEAKSEGKSVEDFNDEAIAKQLNISPRQVQKIREVEKKANPKQLESLKKGETTINKIHKELKSAECKKSAGTKNVLEIEPSDSFLELYSKTQYFLEELEVEFEQKGYSKQAEVLHKYCSTNLSPEVITNIWQVIINSIEKSLKKTY